jgi:hypothetical protein
MIFSEIVSVEDFYSSLLEELQAKLICSLLSAVNLHIVWICFFHVCTLFFGLNTYVILLFWEVMNTTSQISFMDIYTK